MSDPFAGDGATDPVSPDATGVYVTGNTTYDSTIDAGVTDLYIKYAYDEGCAGAGLLPIVAMFHGYIGDADSLTSTDLGRWAARGFLAASFGLRGRNGATGSRDASGREIHDAIDGMAHLRALFDGMVRTDHAAAVGWSGGGANVLGLRCKSDLFTVTADFFGPCYFGPGPYGWYEYGVDYDSDILLDADLGGSPEALPLVYSARDVRPAIAKAMALGGWLWMGHDSEDVSVSIHGTDDMKSALDAARLTNYTYTRTTALSATRCHHGHPTDSADLVTLENQFARRMRDTDPLIIPTSGSLLLMGFYKSVTRDFEVWVGDEANPRTNGTGGTNRRALLAYDVTAGRYTVTPLDGPCTVYLRHGNTVVTASTTLAARTVTIDAVAGTATQTGNDLDGAPRAWRPVLAGSAPVSPWVPTGATAIDWHTATRRASAVTLT